VSTPAPQFTPTPFATAIVRPDTASLFRRAPYISVSEFSQAPTAIATNTLVPGGTEAQQQQSLANTIMRASDWVDTICFHSQDGTLAASPSTESSWVKAKPDGSLALQCYYRPVLEVDAVAIGWAPNQLQNISQATADTIWIDNSKTIWVPACFPSGTSFPTWPPTAVGRGGGVYAIWQYVSGFPHSSLAQPCSQGATAITIAPAVPGGVYGVYSGTPLVIHDNANTETVIVESVSGTTLTLSAGTQFAHTPPAYPDQILVSAIPWVVEQACISLASCLIKMRGSRAAQLPQTAGTPPPRQAIMQAGGLEDYQAALSMLKPFTTVYRRTAN
jgi:hypothetical protein